MSVSVRVRVCLHHFHPCGSVYVTKNKIKWAPCFFHVVQCRKSKFSFVTDILIFWEMKCCISFFPSFDFFSYSFMGMHVFSSVWLYVFTNLHFLVQKSTLSFFLLWKKNQKSIFFFFLFFLLYFSHSSPLPPKWLQRREKTLPRRRTYVCAAACDDDVPLSRRVVPQTEPGVTGSFFLFFLVLRDASRTIGSNFLFFFSGATWLARSSPLT